MTIVETAELASPIGRITLAVRDGRLCALDFTERWPRRRAVLEKRFGQVEFRQATDPAGAASRLKRYFAGDLEALTPIGVDPGGTAFQRKVWSALRGVPPGRTASYGDLARAIGAAGAARAVGAANGSNPIAIVIPCHRVIGADGSLTGYAGGVERKQWLLRHESGRRLRPRGCGAAPNMITTAQGSSASAGACARRG
ncbi:MAG: methylated-DNA--[protein]-cysteine S-methyltransferase [Deltaproteobacteria bacterium]|nr:MAG: methylated-DNA--[protein]-cysteine S-methyltransferase [Deltaproteobacteria bacterium]